MEKILGGRNVFWVEDDQFLGDVLARKFSEVGASLTRVKNGEEALKHLQSNIPEVIILDILLPEMSGFDLLKKIREDHALDAVPVIMLSNVNQLSELEQASQLGAQRFLVKSEVSLDEIVKNVAEVIKK